MKMRFALVMTLVLIGFLAVPAFSEVVAAERPAQAPSWKRELFGAPLPLSPSELGAQDSGGNNPALMVGPNVRVNAPQEPFPAGLLGRSETTIAVAPDGSRMVAGWNDAQGFCGPPFGATCKPQKPNGLSGYAFSVDGGLTWEDGGAPDPKLGRSSVGVPVFTRGDPWLAVDRDGNTFFYANLAVNAHTGDDLGVSVHRGSFLGANFAWQDVRVFNSPNAQNLCTNPGPPPPAQIPCDFYDKEAIATDPNDPNNAVVSVTNFQGQPTIGPKCGDLAQFGFGQIEVWRTRDGGANWLGPAIAGPERPDSVKSCGDSGTLQQSSAPAFGPDGEVFVTWQVGPTFDASGGTSTGAAIFVARSFDGGATFDKPNNVATINSMRQNAPVGYNRDRINDHPRIAVMTEGDSAGRVLVAFYSAVAPVTAAPITACPAPVTGLCRDQRLTSSQVFVSFSDDQGKTFGKPVPVAPAPPSTGLKRWWPVVTVGDGGDVNVVYYESNESPVPSGEVCQVTLAGGATPLRRRGPAHSLVDTFIAQSVDGGETFGAPVKVSSVTSDWCTALTNIRPNFGDYIGAVTVGQTTFAVWADSRDTILVGGVPRHVVDVFFAPVGP